MMDSEMRYDCVILTCNPDKKFDRLVEMIVSQTVRPSTLILVHTETELCSGEMVRTRALNVMGAGIEVDVVSVDQDEFDHGGTRNLGESYAVSPYVLFMTQDAVPVSDEMCEKLLGEIKREKVAVAYARQIASNRSSLKERISREYNYPAKSLVKSKADFEKLGIKTIFCSDVCAMYDRDIFAELEGFERHCLFGEDMIYANKAVMNGYEISYQAEAMVIHSHDYGYMKQFHRNFDCGAAQAMHPEVYRNLSSEGEGIKYAAMVIKKHLEKWMILGAADFVIECMFKYAGFFLGKHYKVLPKSLVCRLTMNKRFFTGR